MKNLIHASIIICNLVAINLHASQIAEPNETLIESVMPEVADLINLNYAQKIEMRSAADDQVIVYFIATSNCCTSSGGSDWASDIVVVVNFNKFSVPNETSKNSKEINVKIAFSKDKHSGKSFSEYKDMQCKDQTCIYKETSDFDYTIYSRTTGIRRYIPGMKITVNDETLEDSYAEGSDVFGLVFDRGCPVDKDTLDCKINPSTPVVE